MEYLFKILKEYEGIFGTLIGSISTLIITDLLKRKGELKIYLMEWEGKFKTKKESGIWLVDGEEDSIEHYKYKFVIHIYNSSEIPKIMRNISVEFFQEDLLLLKSIPNDSNNSVGDGMNRKLYPVEVININSKEVILLTLFNYLHDEELTKIKSHTHIVLAYNDEKNKNKIFNIYKNNK